MFREPVYINTTLFIKTTDDVNDNYPDDSMPSTTIKRTKEELERNDELTLIPQFNETSVELPPTPPLLGNPWINVNDIKIRFANVRNLPLAYNHLILY